MRRYFGTPSVMALLALASGATLFLWSAHDLGDTCGFRNLKGEPSGPSSTALVLLIVVPALLTAARARSERRSIRAIAAFTILAALIAGAAVGVAVLALAVSRNCFQ
jgi:hypothetical protein